MDKYEAVRDQIRRAHLERSVYLAELLSGLIVDSWNGIRNAASRVVAYARSKPATRSNVFTFDA